MCDRSSSVAYISLCLECRVSWVQIPSEAAVLLCFVVCMTLLASFFLPSSSLINMYKQLCVYVHVLTAHVQFNLMIAVKKQRDHNTGEMIRATQNITASE